MLYVILELQAALRWESRAGILLHAERDGTNPVQVNRLFQKEINALVWVFLDHGDLDSLAVRGIDDLQVGIGTHMPAIHGSPFRTLDQIGPQNAHRLFLDRLFLDRLFLDRLFLWIELKIGDGQALAWLLQRRI